MQAKEVKDISGLTHGVGWCAPQQGTCKLTLNVKEGIIQEALVETIGCSGMTHSAAMASEILPGKTILEALNTDLVCDAINTAMRELFLQIVYGRTQSAFSEDGLPIGAGLEDLGKGLRSQVGTMYGTLAKGPRYLEMAEGYVTGIALDENNEIIGYKFVSLGKSSDSVIALVQYVFGAVVIFHGVLDVQSSVSLMRQGAARWWLDLALSALTLALGALILINPFGTFAALVTLIGLVLIYDGLSDLWIIHRLSRMVRDLERDLNGDIIETRGRDLDE